MASRRDRLAKRHKTEHLVWMFVFVTACLLILIVISCIAIYSVDVNGNILPGC